jgi:predicted metal-binding protein
MKKIAVLRCFKVSSKCSGCIKAFNNKNGSFNDYDATLDMVMQIPCSGCNEKSIKEILNSSEKLKKQGVSSVHLSTCIRASCPYYKEFINELSKDFKVVGYTHGVKKY